MVGTPEYASPEQADVTTGVVDEKSDVYSLGGDCYAKLGRDADARRYYNLSYAKDWIVNYWAISRLAGE